MRKHISIILSVSALLCSSLAFSAEPTTQDTIYRDKTAEYNYETQSGTITLENYVPGEMKISHDAKPLDAILVLDHSSSMLDGYGTDSTFTRVVAAKKYAASSLYYAKNRTLSQFDTVATKQTTIYYDSNCKNPVTVNGNQVSVIYIVNPNLSPSSSSWTTSDSRCWAYYTSGGKRYFIREDGSTIEEQGSTTITWSTFPKGVDGFSILPAYHDNEGTIITTFKDTLCHTSKRVEALRFSVGKFIDLVAEHASKTGKLDRIAIVDFQGGGTYDYPNPLGFSSDNYLNSSSPNYLSEWPSANKATGGERDWSNRSFVAKRFVDMSTTNAARFLKYAIGGTTPKGNTSVYDGMKIANELMSKSGRKGDSIARFIIVFSDGEPTQSSGQVWGSGQGADKAVSQAYTLKNSTTGHKSIVYTIYCNSNDPSANSNSFMDHLSSNYPYAQAYNDATSKLPTDQAKYYKTAKDNLAVVFDGIAQEIIVETTSKYNVNTTLNDFVNNAYFKLPDEVDQTTAYDNILVYENKCAGYDKTNKTYSWATFEGDSTKLLKQSDGIQITITKRDQTDPTSNDKVEVKGYDFSKNWCGMDISKTPNVAHGARLVIKIPFVYTKTQVFGDLPTNTNESGITVVDDKGEKIEEKKYPVPTLPFCYIKIQRDSLHKGESAIYLIEKPLDDGTYEFVDKVVVNGSGSKIDTCALYGVPGTTFRITETNWNWAYEKENNPQTKSLPTGSDGKPTSYRLFYEFKGDHIVPTGGSHEKEKNPANLHNHDEAFKVNSLALPKTTK